MAGYADLYEYEHDHLQLILRRTLRPELMIKRTRSISFKFLPARPLYRATHLQRVNNYTLVPKLIASTAMLGS